MFLSLVTHTPTLNSPSEVNICGSSDGAWQGVGEDADNEPQVGLLGPEDNAYLSGSGTSPSFRLLMVSWGWDGALKYGL